LFLLRRAGREGAYPHHHPRFVIDETALPVLIETMTGAAMSFLTAAEN
jgi:metal-dependent amidase/aminoacylase/carboxypeptidase family protein